MKKTEELAQDEYPQFESGITFIGNGFEEKKQVLLESICGNKETNREKIYGAPICSERLIDVGLDRQSFLDRGWREDQIGSWSNGSTSPTNRRGLFLSMFYALQMNNAAIGPHPWNEQSNDWDRGLGAHIDWWCSSEHGFGYRMYVYDHANPPTKRAIIVGRHSTEYPFSAGGPCSGERVIGCAGASEVIYIRTDWPYSLGRRIDDAMYVLDSDGVYRLNITYLIAHEMGHYMGFGHVQHPECIMNPTIVNNPKKQRWQIPEDITIQMFKQLSNYLD